MEYGPKGHVKTVHGYREYFLSSWSPPTLLDTTDVANETSGCQSSPYIFADISRELPGITLAAEVPARQKFVSSIPSTANFQYRNQAGIPSED
jgi:hypothetical protein